MILWKALAWAVVALIAADYHEVAACIVAVSIASYHWVRLLKAHRVLLAQGK
jgi:hypothetical protein